MRGTAWRGAARRGVARSGAARPTNSGVSSVSPPPPRHALSLPSLSLPIVLITFSIASSARD